MQGSLALGSFLAGILMFLAPCTLPLVPGYLAFIGDASVVHLQSERARSKVLFNGAAYAFGFSLTFMLFGLAAGALGAFLGYYRQALVRVAGAFVVFFGLITAGVIKTSWLAKEGMPVPRAVRRGHPLGSFFLGVSFASGWSPCVGPILGTVLTLAATEGSLLSGVWYLLIFSLGLAVPFLLLAAFLSTGTSLIRRATPFLNAISIIGGWALVIIGFLLLTNRMAYLTAWGSNLMPHLYDWLMNYF